MNRKVNVMIIDDEPLARQTVTAFLKEFPDIEVLAEASDGFEALRLYNDFKPDLLFLDIQMPKINGFELLEVLPDLPAVIFTTAFDEYALKAFELQAIDYLLKPFSRERFAKAVQKAIQMVQEQQPHTEIEKLGQISHKQPDESKRIVVKSGADIEIIPIQNIDYIEAWDDYVKIYIGKQYHLKKKTLSYYEQSLDPTQFIRIHRSFLLNITKLTRIEAVDKSNHVAVLSSGYEIPISRGQYPLLKQKLGI